MDEPVHLRYRACCIVAGFHVLRLRLNEEEKGLQDWLQERGCTNDKCEDLLHLLGP